MSSLIAVPDANMRKANGNAMLKIEGKSGSASVFVCQFNPDEFQINTRGTFSKNTRMGKDTPIVQFIGGQASSLDLHLYFDTSTSYEIKTGLLAARPKKAQPSDVSFYANTLLQLVRIEGKEHRPPVVVFCWGSFSFGGFAESVSVKYTMFEKGGMPVRCEVFMRLIALDNELLSEERMSPKESPDRTKSVVFKEGMSLYDIAEEEYGDAGAWREIARANGILDPLSVEAGTRLVVPALT